MRSTTAQKYNDGFTLIEVLIVLIMVGILSAIAAPSLIGMYQRNQLRAALNQVNGAFQEGQRQSMRTSKSCTLTLSATNQISGSCLVNGTRQLSGVSMRASLSSMQFNFKGQTLNTSNALLTQPITVVISMANSGRQACLVVSTPLGLTRTGTYTGSNTVDTNCMP